LRIGCGGHGGAGTGFVDSRAAPAPGEVQELVGACAEGDLVRLDADLCGARAWEKAVAVVRAHFARSPSSRWRTQEGLGLSRKWAVPAARALDRERVTKREGNVRTVGPSMGDAS
jgi:hypothetical protein